MRGLIVLAIIAVAACARTAPVPPPRPNIVLITIDTLRADRVTSALTPNLDRLGSRGLRFVNARSAVPLTLPSHTTILTGLLPAAHGVRVNGQQLAASIPTVARQLHEAGYHTAAFIGAYVLDHRFGLADGFDTYDDRIRRDPKASERLEASRPGSEVADAAIAWLAHANAPFFVWVHLYDPHAPYTPPAEYLARAGGRAYDGEVAYADAQVGRLLEQLATHAADTVFVVAGDHGEGLGEHGEGTHGMLAYDSTLRVPLLMAGPGVPARTVSSPVSLTDVAPSLRHLAGLAATKSDGVDLMSAPAAERDVRAETRYPATAGWHPLTVLAGPQWKLIQSSEPELYDLAADPGEQQNLAAARPAIVSGMASQLQASASDTPSSAPSAEAAERLRSLGYVSASTPSGTPSDAASPARHAAAWTAFEHDLTLLNEGRPADALPSLAALAREFPAGALFLSTYARALKDAGKPSEALKVYRAAVEHSPADATLFHDLAVAAAAAGDRAEALRAEQAALAIDGSDPRALNGSGLLLAEAGRPADAAPLFERAASVDSSNASYWTNLGNARRDLRDASSAEAAYRRALEADPSYGDAANGIGVLLVQQHRAPDAIAWFRRALESTPDLHEARLNLGIAYQQSGQPGEAARVYREILAGSGGATPREKKAAQDLLGGLR